MFSIVLNRPVVVQSDYDVKIRNHTFTDIKDYVLGETEEVGPLELSMVDWFARTVKHPHAVMGQVAMSAPLSKESKHGS